MSETTDWVDAGENVLLFGASGLGKSHLAAAIVEGVVNQGYRARFYNAGELLQELRKARSLLRLNELLLRLDRYRVIVIDDLGYVNHSDFRLRKNRSIELLTLLCQRPQLGSPQIS
ncbi:hypothetical protein ASE99_24000 [Serratia sp. Leaf51]|nr:hypothetical protein ASE99_24000 [Serratia sp. Leaf51]